MPYQIWKTKNNIRTIVKAKGWTALDLRAAMNEPPPLSLIYKWYRNLRQPGKKYLEQLLQTLDCAKEELVYVDK